MESPVLLLKSHGNAHGNDEIISQETDTATTAEERLERPRLSTSAARRMRRKRAAERAAQAALEHRGEKVAPLSAGRATRITGTGFVVGDWFVFLVIRAS